jgi:quercetin dioxygenase-like cupin family protein
MATIGSPGVLVLPGEGKAYPAFGGTLTMKATSEATGGALEVAEGVLPAAGGTPLHVHRTYDEAHYVLAGEMTVRVGDRTFTAPAGSLYYVPRGIPHTSDNLGAAPCRVLVMVMPAAGLDRFLEEMSRLPPGPPDPATIGALMQKYDVEVVGPPLGQAAR